MNTMYSEQATIDLKDLLSDYVQGNDQYSLESEDGNHWIRRFYRCYIDGCYKGESHYKENIRRITEAKGNRKKLKSFAIQSFVEFLSSEFEISSSTIQKTVVNSLSDKQLERLNNELINDSLDLIK